MDVEYELTAAMALGHAPATNDGRSASGVEWLLRTLTAECEHAITELTPFVVQGPPTHVAALASIATAAARIISGP